MQTRLPSNLRSTTRECIHLAIRDHFQSRDKDGGHTIQTEWCEFQYAILENPMLQANFMALCFIEPQLLQMWE